MWDVACLMIRLVVCVDVLCTVPYLSRHTVAYSTLSNTL